MKLYKNPPLIVRLFVIAIGWFFCIIAGVGGSVFWLAIGLGICVFACAWGDREYINVLRKGLVLAKDKLFSLISLIRK